MESTGIFSSLTLYQLSHPVTSPQSYLRGAAGHVLGPWNDFLHEGCGPEDMGHQPQLVGFQCCDAATAKQQLVGLYMCTERGFFNFYDDPAPSFMIMQNNKHTPSPYPTEDGVRLSTWWGN